MIISIITHHALDMYMYMHLDNDFHKQ